MQEPRQLNEAAWLDPIDGTVSIGLTDSVTLTVHLEEFLDFYNNIDEIRSIILDQDDIAMGITIGENGVQKEQLMMKPDEGDYN